MVDHVSVYPLLWMPCRVHPEEDGTSVPARETNCPVPQLAEDYYFPPASGMLTCFGHEYGRWLEASHAHS